MLEKVMKKIEDYSLQDILTAYHLNVKAQREGQRDVQVITIEMKSGIVDVATFRKYKGDEKWTLQAGLAFDVLKELNEEKE